MSDAIQGHGAAVTYTPNRWKIIYTKDTWKCKQKRKAFALEICFRTDRGRPRVQGHGLLEKSTATAPPRRTAREQNWRCELVRASPRSRRHLERHINVRTLCANEFCPHSLQLHILHITRQFPFLVVSGIFLCSFACFFIFLQCSSSWSAELCLLYRMLQLA